MIILKTLKFSNLFSYGKDNIIKFDENPIVQLIGKNGHGKSSIALILEEVLFNKNSKGIKKADILNRHVKDKSYSIELEFEKDGENYVIQTSRGSSQTVTFFKETENISAHTATATFKAIEEVLGFDHKAFSQLVYQSSSSSLEFLTATDTNRKKFLIDLLNLSKYVEAFEVFKKLGKEVESEVTALESKVKTTQAWLDKHLKESLEEMEIKSYPVYADDPNAEASGLRVQLATIDSTNKRIAKNEIAKKQLAAIDISELTKSIPTEIDGSRLVNQLGGHERVVKDADAFIAKVSKLNGTCPTCQQTIDTVILQEIINEKEQLKKDAEEAIEKLNVTILERSKNSKEASRLAKLKQDWENLHTQIDLNTPSEPLNPDDISKKLFLLENEIVARNREISELEKYNQKASANNARVQLITSQMDEMKSSIGQYSQELFSLTEKLSIIQVLQKTFSTNGLIAYKIECLVKDLEVLANEYLAELSGGRFQLTFKVSSGDKLNVIITDNGRDIDILALSGGERARVNTATLLAIRKLMQSLSNVRINLLVLDETIDSLDNDGKEKLVEVLIKEEHLNTFLISHGFTHPLLEKITVVKENNISRLE
jgi:DNA repair exonuclease SbcCD ATPase subunit